MKGGGGGEDDAEDDDETCIRRRDDSRDGNMAAPISGGDELLRLPLSLLPPLG